MRSSLGFHTIMLSKPMFSEDISQLLMDCKEYSRKFHTINVYFEKNGDEAIKFSREDKGIKWKIKRNVWLNRYDASIDIIYATINPKILSGINDYITAATYDDMEKAITNFNLISKQISPALGAFDDYRITRIDYCINFDLDELAPGCSYELIMALVKRADIPPPYKEWKVYDTAAHRMKSRPGSFYLTNNSVHINCYSKYMKLLEQSHKNVEKGYPPIRQSVLDAAKNIIRFEVQCMYHKTYSLSQMAKKTGNNEWCKYENLLAQDACIDEINYYFKKIIGTGDWYALQDAIRIIEHQGFNCQKERRLIDTVKLIAQYRSLNKTKATLQGSELESFKKTLKNLSSLGINPVTIPRERGIRHIPHLLTAYFDKVQEEEDLKEMNPYVVESYKNYIQKSREKEVVFSFSPPS